MTPLPPPIDITMPDGSVMTLIAEATLTPEEQSEGLAILRELAEQQRAKEGAAA